MSTYSPNLRIELIDTGTQAGTWGNTTNTNLGALIEDAIAGYTNVFVTSANQALTALNGAADQSRNMILGLTTTVSVDFAIYAPPAEKTYVIRNNTAYTATIYNSTVLGNTTAAGTGVAIPAGKTMTVWTEGTNFAVQNSHVIGTVVGNVTGNVTGDLTGNVTGNLNGNLTAVAPTASTAAPGTNTTQIATTAFVTTLGATKANTATTISAGTGLSGGGDLSANRSLAIANTGVAAGTYGSGTQVPVITVNAQGQVTAASQAANIPRLPVLTAEQTLWSSASGWLGSFTKYAFAKSLTGNYNVGYFYISARSASAPTNGGTTVVRVSNASSGTPLITATANQWGNLGRDDATDTVKSEVYAFINLFEDPADPTKWAVWIQSIPGGVGYDGKVSIVGYM